MEAIVYAVILLAALGLVAGVGLCVANHFMGVKEDERVTRLKEVLPGANCGACGFSGCAGYAEALASSTPPSAALCVVGGNKVAAEVAVILGTEASSVRKMCARVSCRGTCDATASRADYVGLESCRAAALVSGGARSCSYGCLGLGDCVRACDSDAIRIRHGIAVVDETLCIGCGKCAAACPKGIVSVIPADTATVLCRNPEKGALTKAVCSAGCVGCRLCEKACPEGAVKVEGGLARIDSTLCVGCGKCASACRLGVIYMAPVSSSSESNA